MQGPITKEIRQQMKLDAEDIERSLAAIHMAIAQYDEEIMIEVDDSLDAISHSLRSILRAAGAAMHNLRMEEKLKSGECIDVSGFPKEGHLYVLPRFVEGVDYCNAESEGWIWSIGRHRMDGTIYASHSTELYQNPDYECLFLR